MVNVGKYIPVWIRHGYGDSVTGTAILRRREPGNKTGESSFSCVWFSMREIRMMVQKSGAHLLRLVVYPIILQGFRNIQTVLGPWDFLKNQQYG